MSELSGLRYRADVIAISIHGCSGNIGGVHEHSDFTSGLSTGLIDYTLVESSLLQPMWYSARGPDVLFAPFPLSRITWVMVGMDSDDTTFLRCTQTAEPMSVIAGGHLMSAQCQPVGYAQVVALFSHVIAAVTCVGINVRWTPGGKREKAYSSLRRVSWWSFTRGIGAKPTHMLVLICPQITHGPPV
ncbi:hypothetical protein BDP55DRAFT_629147 [Colletotrichum godetiae]|uniref:Uncharacterized protein n=1 Tax=Colletotrichum godetiae TaxID=1209918 RepID=A0AAJ0ARR6_9PEZI|nr:uncharacterized protein BDP55DRAFT_629147 [Colletotrichum godetiae]KAK1689174.1 hypothetical protein BDP55DRAFT_629147 [Colletotrichum godetiae]